MLAFSIDYYGIFFGATQSVELFCTYDSKATQDLNAYGKDAVSCQRERSQKVDAEIPELGSGIESADSPLRRTAYCLSVREKKSRNGEALLSPSFLLSVYSFGIYIIARNFRSYSSAHKRQ